MPAGCTLVNPIGCVTAAAQSVAADAFDAIARDFGHAAQALIGWLWSQLSSSTAVHLGGAGFDTDLAIVAAITGSVALGLFVVQLITSTLRRDAGGLARAGKGLVVAFVAGGAAVAITNAALGAVDALSSGVVRTAMGTDIAGMGQKVLSGEAIMTLANPAALLLVSIGTIAAAVVVWFALMVRKVLIVVSAVFAPLAFAGSLADVTVSWTRRWIEVMAALVVSKLVLVVVFVVGWGVLGGGVGLAGTGASQGLTQIAAGLLILAVAGLAPWMALKLVHFSGEQFHHLHALAGAATGGAAAAVAAPQKLAAWRATAAGFGVGVPKSGSGAPNGSTAGGAENTTGGGSGGSGADGGGATSGPRAGPGAGGTTSGLGRPGADLAGGSGASSSGRSAPPVDSPPLVAPSGSAAEPSPSATPPPRRVPSEPAPPAPTRPPRRPEQ
jgi:type IV secretion system protein TrbL